MAAYKGRWPLGRGFERFYGFLGGESNSWYPGPGPRQPPDRPAGHARGGLPPRRRTSPTRRSSSSATPRSSTPTSRSSCTSPRRRPRAAPRLRGVGRQVQGHVRRGLRGDPRRRSSRARRSSACCRRTPSCRRSTRTASRSATGPDGQPWPLLDTVRPWDSLSADEQRLFARMAEVFAGYISYTDDQLGRVHRLPRGVRPARQHDHRRDLRQRRERRGRPERLVQRVAVLQRRRRHDRASRSQHIDELGSPQSYNHYNTGWAWAFDTPFPYWKRWAGLRGRRRRHVPGRLAGADQGRRASCASSTSTRSTSSRRSTTCSASSRPR